MKRILAALCAGAMLISGAALAADTTTVPRVTLTASKATEANEVVLTVAVKSTSFNVVQLAVDYDETKLTPKSVVGDAPVTDPSAMTDFYELYERGQGWMSYSVGEYDSADGVVEYVLSVNPNSKNRPTGSDSDGYVTAGSEGRNLITLHFTLKDTAVFTADSIELATTASNSDYIIVSTKTENPASPEMIKGRSLGLRDFTALGIPLSETAESAPPEETDPPKEPEQPENPGGSTGGGTGTGTGETTRPDENKDPVSGGTAVQLNDIAGHWAEKDIRALAEKGILTGYGDGTFRPGDLISRGECCILLCRALELEPVDAGAEFSDLAGVWAAPYINAAHKAGLVNGVGGGRFDAGRRITRQEVFQLIATAFQLPAGAGESGSFSDSARLGAWAVDATDRVVAAGIVKGSGGLLNPNGEISRGEMAAMLSRALERSV